MVAIGGNGGGKAFQFEKIGDFVEGIVISAKMRQQTDMDDGEPLVWYKKKPTKAGVTPNNGAGLDPVEALWVTLKTELRGNAGLSKPVEDDDGERTIIFSGNKWTELVKVTNDVSEGDYLRVEFKEFGEKKKPGHNPPKLFTGGITHRKGTATVTLDKDKAESAEVLKPDYIPQAAWDAMDEGTRRKIGI